MSLEGIHDVCLYESTVNGDKFMKKQSDSYYWLIQWN